MLSVCLKEQDPCVRVNTLDDQFQTGNTWLHILPNELSLGDHLCSSKAEFPSQEHGKIQFISHQLPSPTCCHTLQHRLVETQEGKKKNQNQTTKPCRGLGRLICLASVSMLRRQQRLWQRQQVLAGTQGHCRQDWTLLPGWSSPHPAALPHCSIFSIPRP